jgi:hypothetical protein
MKGTNKENTKTDWIAFTTETGLNAKYLIIGDNLRDDVVIKIVTSMPRSYYYSALSEAGAYYDEIILPTLNPTKP